MSGNQLGPYLPPVNGRAVTEGPGDFVHTI